MNIGVHVCFQIMVVSGYMPKSGIEKSYDNYFWSSKETSYCIPQWMYQFTVPPMV